MPLEVRTTVKQPSYSPTDAELSLLADVIAAVARARRLTPDDREDFTQTAQMRLLERGYDVFRRYSGRSSLRTYLTVIVNRLLLDWRNSCYGKWRPAAASVRLGREAMALDRLVNRDGYSAHEAVNIMRAATSSPESLERLVDAIPKRPWRRFVAVDHLQELPGPPFVDPLDDEEDRRSRGVLRREVARSLRRLPLDDRRLLDARFRQGRSVQAVAASLKVDPRALYRRYEHVLRTLRGELIAFRRWPDDECGRRDTVRRLREP